MRSPLVRWLAKVFYSVLKKFKFILLLVILGYTVGLLYLLTNDLPQSVVSQSLWARLAGPLPYNDSKLIGIVKQHFLHVPSSLPYNLMNTGTSMKAETYNLYKWEFAYQFCQKAIKDIFKEVKHGFFVEAGAIDGEYLSNTLFLELENDWTGLLVEVDEDMFRELLTKGRRVWASHCCLATHDYPHQDVLLKYAKKGKSDIFGNRAASAHASLLSIRHGITLDNSEPGHRIYERAQCLPLATLLLAVGTRHVDLISLDVEGAETGILRTFPWDEITVDVWIVEHTLLSPEAKETPQLRSDGYSEASTALSEDTKKPWTQPETLSGFDFRPAINLSLPSLDHDFIGLFRHHGYELYAVSEDILIPNYVFVLKSSNAFRRLNKRFKGQTNR